MYKTIKKKYHNKLHKIIKYEPGELVLIQFSFREHSKSTKANSRIQRPLYNHQKINKLNYKIKLIINDIDFKLSVDTERVFENSAPSCVTNSKNVSG